MATLVNDSEWIGKLFLAETVKTVTNVNVANRSPRVASSITTKYPFTSDNNDGDFVNDDFDEHTLYDEDEYKRKKIIHNIKISEKRVTRMKHMLPQFFVEPKLEKICKDWNNKLIDTNFQQYRFDELTSDSHKNKPSDLKYVVNFCGSQLTYLNIHRSCSSSVMPLIKSNCFNLNTLFLKFHIIKSEDFENCFSNMPHLEVLVIQLECEDSTLPITLVKSLEQVGERLKTFSITIEPKQSQLCSPDSSVSVSSPSAEALMSTIVKMKNLEKLSVHINHGVTDEFLINLINNAQMIGSLFINGSNITDTGIKALDNAKQLQYFSLDLCKTNSKNELITYESLQCLSNQKLIELNLSNCINVTNDAVITLVTKLPSIRYLYVDNSKVNREICKDMAELKKCSKTNLIIFTY